MMSERLLVQDEMLRTLSEASLHVAVVLRNEKGRSILASGDSLLEVKSHPEGVVGATVLVVGETQQIYKAIPRVGVGPLVTVTSVSKGYVEFQGHSQGAKRAINPHEGVEVGHRVLLDAGEHVVLQNLGSDNKFKVDSDSGVTWDDIGGLELPKQLMIEAIESPTIHAGLHKAYGKSRVKGILLYGASGCGKTMLGKAAASSIRKTHGGKGGDTNFIYVKGPAILNMYVGNSEGNIRELFARGRAHFAKHGYPAILFIDEADALFRTRERHSTSGMESTVVPQFLSEMDGLDESGVTVIIATNLPKELDAAVVREGRIDRKIKVTRPKAKDAAAIMARALRNRPLADNGSAEEFATIAATDLYNPARSFYEVSMKTGGKTRIALGDLTNGAMVQAVVEEATAYALRRDEASKATSPSGIRLEDIQQAVDFIDAQNRDVDHERDLQDLLEAVQPHIEEVRKVRGEPRVSSNGKAPRKEENSVLAS